LIVQLIHQLIQPSTRDQPENDWSNWCFDWWLKLSRTATLVLHHQYIVQQCLSLQGKLVEYFNYYKCFVKSTTSGGHGQ